MTIIIVSATLFIFKFYKQKKINIKLKYTNKVVDVVVILSSRNTYQGIDVCV